MALLTEQQQAQDRLARAAHGDTEAFAEIVREHQGMVFGVACQYLRDRAAAEEMAQEIFVQLYRDLAALESPAHVAHWLRRVTVHRSIDQMRRRKWWSRKPLEDVPEPGAWPTAADPLLSRRLRHLIGTLPEAWRMVVVLRYQEDLEPSEIAATLGIPVATVKSQLNRAVGLLRTKLQRQERGAEA